MIPAVVMPVMVALSRLYRGEHHPTDLLASVLFAGLWLTAATLLIKPVDDGRPARKDDRPATRGGRRPAASHVHASGGSA